jgi:hypothetical protein
MMDGGVGLRYDQPRSLAVTRQRKRFEEEERQSDCHFEARSNVRLFSFVSLLWLRQGGG